ncbi:MAG: glycosyltransferase family 9 protein [Solirubrobacteraceae bacterium]
MPSDRQHMVAILRLDHIGDLVLTGPFLVELRAAYPASHIILVVSTTNADLARRLSVVDEVLTVPDRRTRWFGRTRQAFDRYRLERQLRSRQIDVMIVPRWDVDHYGALKVLRSLQAPVRVGFAEADKRYRRSALTRVVGAPAAEHEALKALRLLPQADHRDWSQLEHPLWYAAEDARAADRLLASAEGPLIVFGIGADEARKVWPAERFARSAVVLCEAFGAVAVIVGGPADRAAAARFAVIAPDSINLVGATSLPVAAAVIARAALFVGNDAGPMHLAAAARVPIVEIRCHPQSGQAEHRYSSARFGPQPGPAVTLQPAVPEAGCSDWCSALEAHCILATSVEDVVAAGTRLLWAVPGLQGGQ